jgi:hypothetical protein
MEKKLPSDHTCHRCNIKKDISNFPKRLETAQGFRGVCKQCIAKRSREKWRKYREMILDYYGRKCVCCGEEEESFLTLDHINDDGYLDRNPNGDKKSGKELYVLVEKQGFPDKYQILCQNCNWGKKIKGICPHQIKNLLSGNLQAKVRFSETVTVRSQKGSLAILRDGQRIQ